MRQMRIGFAEKLHQEPAQPHADGEDADKEARAIARWRLPEHGQQQQPEQQAFEARLVQLAGMARQLVRIGREDHRQREAAFDRASVKLAIDEIRQPPEHIGERDIDRDVIGDAEPVETAAPGDPGNRDQYADDPAVEAHPAFPQLEHIRAGEQLGLVEGRIAESPAENHPERAIEEQIVRMALRHRRAGGLDHLRQVPIAQQDAEQVGERVEAQLEAADLEEIGP